MKRSFLSRFALIAAPVAALVLALSASAEAAPKIVTQKLPNGLEVVLAPDPRTPIVSVNVWYHVGSKDEAPGKNGFAHLFEHVMFQGSKHVPEDTYFRFLERAGSSAVNGTTNTDRTNYFETVPKNRLEVALWLESDRMGFLLDHADEATFKSQREVVKNERRQNYENSPYGLVSEILFGETFPGSHPYHLLTIGTPEDLDRANIDDVRGFFRTWYAPNNATIVLCGDFEPDKALEMVKKYFGPIPSGVLPLRAKPKLVELSGETRVTVEAGVDLGRLYINWPTPAFFDDGDVDLDVVGRILTNGKTSRLYKRMVYDDQIAQDVGAHQSSMQYGSMFSVVSTAKPGKTPADLERVVDEELLRFAKEGPTDAELARAKTGIETDLLFEFERVSSRSNMLNSYAHYKGTPDFLEGDLARLRAVTKESVKNAASRWLKPNARVVTHALPVKGAPIAGRVANIKRPNPLPTGPAAPGGAR